jgi:hypothetical protein
VHLLEEPPDVLDVRVREGVVVVVPVHPHAERRDCWVITSANSATRSRQRAANSASPYASMSRFEFRPRDFSTSTSTQRPWQSKPFW